MFDQILQVVKEHLSNVPEIASAIPKEQTEDVHREVATHINNGLEAQVTPPGALDTVLSHLENNLASGNLMTTAIAGGLIGSLAGKFRLPQFVTGAIAGALPAIIQKMVHKNSETVAAEV